jgi:hypothetical protein
MTSVMAVLVLAAVPAAVAFLGAFVIAVQATEEPHGPLLPQARLAPILPAPRSHELREWVAGQVPHFVRFVLAATAGCIAAVSVAFVLLGIGLLFLT